LGYKNVLKLIFYLHKYFFFNYSVHLLKSAFWSRGFGADLTGMQTYEYYESYNKPYIYWTNNPPQCKRWATRKAWNVKVKSLSEWSSTLGDYCFVGEIQTKVHAKYCSTIRSSWESHSKLDPRIFSFQIQIYVNLNECELKRVYTMLEKIKDICQIFLKYGPNLLNLLKSPKQHKL